MTTRSRLLVAACAALTLSIAGACGSSSNTAAPPSTTTSTTRPVLPDGACVARMSLPNPQQGGSETVIVDSHFPNTAVTLAVKYKSTTSSYSGQLNGDGHGEVTFSIGHPTANFAVEVTATVNSGQETCTSSFTPH
jgi:hypothetical protein